MQILQIRTDQGSSLADDPESATVNLDKKYTHLLKRLEKHLHGAYSVDTIQLSMKLTPNVIWKANLGHGSESVAPPQNKTSLSDNSKRDISAC